MRVLSKNVYCSIIIIYNIVQALGRGRERERERERTKSESESESETYRERASGRESARAQERERVRERRYNPQNQKFLVENILQFNKRPECPFQSSNHAGIPGRQQSSARGGLRAILESAHPSEFAVSNYSRFAPR